MAPKIDISNSRDINHPGRGAVTYAKQFKRSRRHPVEPDLQQMPPNDRKLSTTVGPSRTALCCCERGTSDSRATNSRLHRSSLNTEQSEIFRRPCRRSHWRSSRLVTLSGGGEDGVAGVDENPELRLNSDQTHPQHALTTLADDYLTHPVYSGSQTETAYSPTRLLAFNGAHSIAKNEASPMRQRQHRRSG